MAGRVLRVAVMVLGMLAMVQQTMELKITNPLPNLETLGQKGPIIPWSGPAFAIVLASSTNEKALDDSGLFVFHAQVDIAGRRFRIGRLGISPIVAVVSGSLSAQASVTTQILIDYFPIRGIIHVGSALTIDSSLPIGSVSVVKSAAFSGLWTWLPLRERLEGAVTQLKFGEYGFPNPGLNYLGTISFEKVKVFEPEYTSTPEEKFWHDVDAELYEVATQGIKDVELKQCYNSTHCLPNKPEIAFGLKASTADIYLQNSFFAKFLRNNFNVSTVDEESATVIMTAKANGVPVIVFRAASSSLDKPYDSDFSYVASYNGVLVAAKYIALFPVPLANSY